MKVKLVTEVFCFLVAYLNFLLAPSGSENITLISFFSSRPHSKQKKGNHLKLAKSVTSLHVSYVMGMNNI